MIERKPEQDRETEPTPVPAPPIESSPSATGVVAGDAADLDEAPPARDAGER